MARNPHPTKPDTELPLETAIGRLPHEGYWSSKARTWEDVRDLPDSMVPLPVLRALQQLPTFHAATTPTTVTPPRPQYHLVIHGATTYLVDTSGYNYARYALRINLWRTPKAMAAAEQDEKARSSLQSAKVNAEIAESYRYDQADPRATAIEHIRRIIEEATTALKILESRED